MVKELVFHLGDSKTGTTSIQTVLANGLFETEGPSLTYTAPFNHIPFAKLISHGEAGQLEEAARRLARKLNAADTDLGVISAENFEFTDPAKLALLFDGPFKPWRDKVRFISYIRPHHERFLAAFGERTKKGLINLEMDDFAERAKTSQLLFYTPRVKAWQAAFGDRYTARPFIRERLKDGDVVSDFFGFLFNDAPVTFPARANKNETLSLEDLALMRYVQSHIRSKGHRVNHAAEGLGWNFSMILTANPPEGSSKLRLHKSIALKLQDTYADDAAALDALVFEGSPMSDRLAQATDDALDEPQSLVPLDHHSPEVMRIATAFTEFLSQVIVSDPEHFRWAARQEAHRAPLLNFLGKELIRHELDASSQAGPAASELRNSRLRRLVAATKESARLLRDALR